MYAVFEDGSRQYRVSEGDVVRVDFRDVAKGERVQFDRVLLLQNGDDTNIGRPTVEGVRVVGEVVEHPSVKLYIQHFRRRKNYRRLRGHRQHYTAVQVKHILLPGQEPPAPQPAPAPTSETPAPTSQPPATPPAPATT
jgi:large subunit ribosomal protein L21